MIGVKKYSLLLFLLLPGILFLLIHLFLEEKNSTEEKEVNDANGLRKEQGIPITENHWIRENTGPGREKWHDGVRGINSTDPIHLYKEILYNEGRIEVEKDAFHFEFSDSLQYRLIVYHQYTPDHFIAKRTKNELIIYEPGEFPPSHSKNLSSKSADSVLHTWKLIDQE